MQIKLIMRKELVFMQGNVHCINPKSAKHILDSRETSVFECPDDSLDLNPYKRLEIS